MVGAKRWHAGQDRGSGGQAGVGYVADRPRHDVEMPGPPQNPAMRTD